LVEGMVSRELIKFLTPNLFVAEVMIFYSIKPFSPIFLKVCQLILRACLESFAIEKKMASSSDWKTEVQKIHEEMGTLHERLGHVHKTISFAKPKTFAYRVLFGQLQGIYDELSKLADRQRQIVGSKME
jgi:hypothetical protein